MTDDNWCQIKIICKQMLTFGGRLLLIPYVTTKTAPKKVFSRGDFTNQHTILVDSSWHRNLSKPHLRICSQLGCESFFEKMSERQTINLQALGW